MILKIVPLSEVAKTKGLRLDAEFYLKGPAYQIDVAIERATKRRDQAQAKIKQLQEERRKIK